ncbi:RnfABCDGE type electron transport complex subunit C [Limnochorda pilosa]|uniref:Ion-translocating oxidoreductase complex subunit C n=1 Tax=Limnochorda pilosa TaxID=1555112 RepID=A0A0K2SQH8_LIMPI|nr:RnfABCDGE type electron transport complex subunit C [Limnochorda pilosa]BAS29247.1 electron transporter RnfC [Limnochorda pilosa]
MRGRRMRGGVRTGEQRSPLGPILSVAEPGLLVLACAQAGRPLKPVVKKRDAVLGGQRLAEPEGDGVPLHAPLSGEVTDVGPALGPTGDLVLSIFIKSDGRAQWAPAESGWPDPEAPPPEAIRLRAFEAGIPDLARGGVPLARSLAPDQPVESLILNACVTQPHVQSERVLLHAEPATVLYGLRAAMRATGAHTGMIALSGADRRFARVVKDLLHDGEAVQVHVLSDRFPQGLERYLIPSLTGSELAPGQTPGSLGLAVFDVTTLYALARALRDGRPFTHRLVTVAGDAVATPGNYLVPLGTPVSHLLDAAGRAREPRQIVLGGPLTGVAVGSEEITTCASTRAVLALSQAAAASVPTTLCIRCGRCIDACPEALSPIYLARYAERERWADAEAEGAMLCSGCGACAYVCPAGRYLFQSIQLARYEIGRKRDGVAHETTREKVVVR